jgi:hypothetical protein
MSKFLLNLILQISKALVNSKIQFLIQKLFSLLSARPTPWPVWPPAQPAHQPRCPRRPKESWSAHPARASVTSSRETRFPFRITPSRAGCLSLSLCQLGPTCQIHQFPAPANPGRKFPRATAPPRRCPAPQMPLSFYSPPSSLSPLNPLQTEP